MICIIYVFIGNIIKIMYVKDWNKNVKVDNIGCSNNKYVGIIIISKNNIFIIIK